MPSNPFSVSNGVSYPLIAALLIVLAGSSQAQTSHPRPRPIPQPSTRPAAGGVEKFVDIANGKDTNDGSLQSPWKSAQYGINQLRPGETLNLRKGVYFEQLKVSLKSADEKPYTIRSYPGELAIIDGGISEFSQSPADAWEPFEGGASGEFRSKRAYPNIRDVIGAFEDSMVGLQTYWPLTDLRATNEFWDDPGNGQDVAPVYCGPGMYYDTATGHIHIRLAHTNLQGNVANYKGETDPRKLPLVLASYRSVPLHVDQGQNVRFQDLAIRGGGYETVQLTQSNDIEFDNVTIYCGTYGLKASNMVGLKFFRSALYGNLPPWGFRTENSFRSRKGRGSRNIARLSGHALLIADTGPEYSVYAFPNNDDWEISYSTFTDCHDGLYLGGINMKFHHNHIDNMQDDGIYLSPVYLYGSPSHADIYQNYITRCLTAFAFGGPLTNVKENTANIYRNVIDLRGEVTSARPTPKKPVADLSSGNVMGDHGSPPWFKMNIYHNTFIMAEAPRLASMGIFGGGKSGEYPRRVLNNIFVSLSKLPAYAPMPPESGATVGGNLFWGPNLTGKLATAYFDKAGGPAAKSVAADPKLTSIEKADFRPQSGSPTTDAGVEVPADLPDPLRGNDKGTPDIGALPLDAPPLKAGIEALSAK